MRLCEPNGSARRPSLKARPLGARSLPEQPVAPRRVPRPTVWSKEPSVAKPVPIWPLAWDPAPLRPNSPSRRELAASEPKTYTADRAASNRAHEAPWFGGPTGPQPTRATSAMCYRTCRVAATSIPCSTPVQPFGVTIGVFSLTTCRRLR